MNPIRFLILCLGLLFSTSLIGNAQTEKSKRLFTVIVNDKHGYIDRSGKIVIEPQFDSAMISQRGGL